MGGGCYRIPMRQLFIVGTECENHCFSEYGGCKGDEPILDKKYETCEYAPELDEVGCVADFQDMLNAIDEATKNGESIFLYTPDFFNSFYFDLYQKLPNQPDKTYIAVNACVRSFIDRKIKWEEAMAKGIREVWFGVESASEELRTKYNKPYFTNNEIIGITQGAKDVGVNVCWFLVDGDEDDDKTRLETYRLMCKGNPYRTNIENLRKV